MQSGARNGLRHYLLEHVLPLFGLKDPKYDPWWWPIGTGAGWDDWFPSLKRRDVEDAAGCSAEHVLASLQRGPYDLFPDPVIPMEFDQFRGFWGDSELDGRRIVVVSLRPSRNPWPQCDWKVLPMLLRAIGCGGVHVTDIIKRRGPARKGSTDDFPRQESLPGYVGTLVEELRVLSGDKPKPLHIVPMYHEPLRLLTRYHVGHTLEERLGQQVTLGRPAPPFPTNRKLSFDEKVDLWRRALNQPTAERRTFSVPHGVKADGRARKEPGFWNSASTRETYRAFLKCEILKEEAMKRLDIGRDEIALRYYGRKWAKVLGVEYPRAK